MIDENTLRLRINLFVAQAGSQQQAAQKIGCSLGYLNDYLHGRRAAGNKILDALHLERITMYRQKKPKNSV